MLVVSGMGKIRYVSGNSTIVIPFLQQVDHLNLGVVQCLLTTTEKIPTNDAILITAKARGELPDFERACAHGAQPRRTTSINQRRT